MTEYNKGWWSCFISFAGETLDNGLIPSDSDIKICNAVLNGAGVTSREIQDVLESMRDLLDGYPKTREYLDVKSMELFTEEEGGEE